MNIKNWSESPSHQQSDDVSKQTKDVRRRRSIFFSTSRKTWNVLGSMPWCQFSVSSSSSNWGLTSLSIEASAAAFQIDFYSPEMRSNIGTVIIIIVSLSSSSLLTWAFQWKEPPLEVLFLMMLCLFFNVGQKILCKWVQYLRKMWGLKSRLNDLFIWQHWWTTILNWSNWEKSKYTCTYKSKQTLYTCNHILLIHNRILSSNQLSFRPFQSYQIKRWFKFDFSVQLTD